MLTSLAIRDAAPYETVLTHGFTVDEQGRKMSKSIGNVIAPQEVWNDLGADILRLWVAATDYRGEMSVSKDILKQMGDSYRRIRNTSRFLLSNLSGFDPARMHCNRSRCWHWIATLWIVPCSCRTRSRGCTTVITSTRSTSACITSVRWIWVAFIWISSRIASTPPRLIPWHGAPARRPCTISPRRWCDGWRRCSAFTAEEIYENLPGERLDSVFLAEWYDGLFALEGDAMGREFWQQVQDVKQGVNKAIEGARRDKVIKGGLSAEVTLFVEADKQALLEASG